MESYIEDLCNGDISALNHIYDEFKTPLYAFLITLTKNHAVAEDLLQETFLKVYDKVNLYVKGSNFKAWIFSIARNLAYDHLRSNRSKWEELDNISETIVIEDEVLNKLNISKALFILSDVDREIVIMHVVGGFKHSEIAKELGLNSNTVRWRYREAIKKLSEVLEGDSQKSIGNRITQVATSKEIKNQSINGKIDSRGETDKSDEKASTLQKGR